MSHGWIAITAVELLVSASSAVAQRVVHIGVGGGIAIPTGVFTQTYSPKGAAMVALIAGSQEYPIGVRLDYSYDQFHGKRTLGKKIPDATMRIVTADAVATLPTDDVKPYAVGGVGWYPYREPTDARRDNDIGVNIGAGITFPCVVGAGFIEGRLHHVLGRKTGGEFFPVTLGLVF